MLVVLRFLREEWRRAAALAAPALKSPALKLKAVVKGSASRKLLASLPCPAACPENCTKSYLMACPTSPTVLAKDRFTYKTAGGHTGTWSCADLATDSICPTENKNCAMLLDNKKIVSFNDEVSLDCANKIKKMYLLILAGFRADFSLPSPCHSVRHVQCTWLPERGSEPGCPILQHVHQQWRHAQKNTNLAHHAGYRACARVSAGMGMPGTFFCLPVTS